MHRTAVPLLLVAGCAAAPRGRAATPPTEIHFAYEHPDADAPATTVFLEVTRPDGAHATYELGTYGGDCSTRRYQRGYAGVAPPPGRVLGTACYLGGAALVVVARAGDELIVRVASQGDGADDATGEALAATPWREQARLRLAPGSRVVARDDQL